MNSTQSLASSILLIGMTMGCVAAASDAQTPANPVSGDSANAAKTPVHIDPKHPLTFRYQFYPPKAISAGEEGTCFVALFVGTDGQIDAVHLLKSSGYPRLDAACVASVVDERMLPATINGRAVVGWFATHISWVLNPGKVLHDRTSSGTPIPRLPEFFELQVGPKFYPATALQRKEHGICLVHLLVNTKGAVSETQLSKSTGFPDLDRACVDAVILAEFTPALAANQTAIDAWTDIAIYWRLPK